MTLVSIPTQRMLDFCQFLRRRGYQPGVAEVLDIFAMLDQSGITDKDIAHSGLRAVCCGNARQWRCFQQDYAEFWNPQCQPAAELQVAATDPRLGTAPQVGLAGSSSQQPDSTHGQSSIDGSGAGRQRTLGKADFRFLSDRHAMQQVEHLAEQLGNRLKRRLGRRRKAAVHRGQLDMRRTLRRSLGTGGLPARLALNLRQPVPLKLVILHDVSHSMTWNNPLLFRFVRGLMRHFQSARAYAFHTRLFPVSHLFREASLDRMRHRLDAGENLWLGGTCIATSIGEFNRNFGRLVSSDSHVIILSDGYDTDKIELLHGELHALRNRCRQILWLNPMLGRAGSSVNARDLSLKMPVVDHFLPANSLHGLELAITALARPAVARARPAR